MHSVLCTLRTNYVNNLPKKRKKIPRFYLRRSPISIYCRGGTFDPPNRPTDPPPHHPSSAPDYRVHTRRYLYTCVVHNKARNHDHCCHFCYRVLGNHIMAGMAISRRDGGGGAEKMMKLIVPLYIYPLRDGELGERQQCCTRTNGRACRVLLYYVCMYVHLGLLSCVI